MSLEEMIAAERATPPAPSDAESKSIWKRIRAGAGSVVPPAAFDISPATTTVTLKAKLAAAIATTTGKIAVAVIVAGGAVGGAAAVGTSGENAEAAVEGPTVAEQGRGTSKRRAAVVPPAPEAVPPVAIEPEPEPKPEPFAAPEADAAPEGAPPEDAAPTAPKKARQKRTFGDELALIRRAQGALAKGRHAEALAVLADHKRDFPRGSMREDRSALRALALCLSGRSDAGRREAERFARRYPRSLYADRVEEACS